MTNQLKNIKADNLMTNQLKTNKAHNHFTASLEKMSKAIQTMASKFHQKLVWVYMRMIQLRDCCLIRSHECYTSVPTANLSISNTPIGPFQMMVWVVSRTSLNVLMESGPISKPIHPSGMLDAGTTCKYIDRVFRFSNMNSNSYSIN